MRFFRRLRRLARAAMPIVRVVSPRVASLVEPILNRDGNVQSDERVYEFIGPIIYKKDEQGNKFYMNSEPRDVAVYFTSVNERGEVSRPDDKVGEFDHLVFKAGKTEVGSNPEVVEPSELNQEGNNRLTKLIDANKSGDIFWCYIDSDEDGTLEFFVDLKNWNGGVIRLFSFDEDNTNDVLFSLGKEPPYGGRFFDEPQLFVWNEYKKFDVDLNIVLLDSRNSATNYSIAVEAQQTSYGHKTLGVDFDDIVPIERIFISAKVTPSSSFNLDEVVLEYNQTLQKAIKRNAVNQ
ncbi:MAG: hypothetical protein AAFO69_05435 [Bacteroidota bacterium]